MTKFIVGTLHTTPTGYWLELADELAGREANTFDTKEQAEAALTELGWDCDIFAVDELPESCR